MDQVIPGDGVLWSKLQLLLVSFSIALFAAALIAIVPYAFASSRPKNFPPGPKTVPFLGNLHLIPPSKAFSLFHQWTQEYGPMIGLKFGPANVVVLNNWKDAQEQVKLLEKRGNIYSSRPPNFIANELICKNETHMLFMPYSAVWKSLRKAVQPLFLSRELATTVQPIQYAEATQTAYDMIRTPENSYEHIQRYTTAVILASVYGQRGEKFESPKVQALYDVQNRFTALLEAGAAPPVDGITFLKHTPEMFAPWKRNAKQIRHDQSVLYYRLFNDTKERMAKGLGTGCFMERLIENQAKNGLDDEHITYLGGVIMEGGSDTTSSTLLSFLLAMLQNPTALKRAQEDVDRVCGTQRSPNMDDLDNLPYIEACMHEILRWRPVAAGGIPHMLTQADTYKGYVFPAGTIFFANTWAIGRDENEYDNPSAFNPDRWLNSKYGIKENVTMDPTEQRKTTYGFGAGRRICPGQKMAEHSLKINIAKIVWTFNVERDEAGSPLDFSVETGYEGGFLVCPKKYPIKITPRSETHVKVIEREFHELKGFYEKFQTF